MTIGDKIRFLRNKNGLTQDDLGRMCGVNKQLIYKYETGIISNIPSNKLELLARALQTTPAYLMGWSEDERDASSNIEQRHDPLTPAESSLLYAYRRAPQEIRTIVDTALAPYGEKSAVSGL